MNKEEQRLAKILEAKSDSEIAILEAIHELEDKVEEYKENIPSTTELLKAIKVIKVDGYTPVKGKDYFTRAEIQEFLRQVTPIKGVHYRDGEPGKPGEPGKDAEVDYNKIIKAVLKKIPPPKDGETPDIEEIIKKVLAKIELPEPKPGEPGKMPDHEVKNGWFRFKKPNGKWGEWIKPGGKESGLMASAGQQITFSTTAPTNPRINQLWVEISQ